MSPLSYRCRNASLGLSIFLTAAFFTTPAFAGKISDGGGSDDKPSAQEVRQAIAELSDMRLDAEWLLAPMKLQSSARTAAPDRELQDILDKMRVGDKIPYHIAEEGACHGADGDQEASAPICGSHKPICFSMALIRARYPRATLKNSLKPLFAHELAHEACAGETLAKRVEHYYSDTLMGRASDVEDLRRNANSLANAITVVRDQVGRRADYFQSDASICLSLGQIRTYSEAFTRQAAQSIRLQTNHEISEQATEANRRWHDLPDQAQGFCGMHYDKSDDGSVKTGDQAALLKVIQREAEAYNSLASEFERATHIKLDRVANSQEPAPAASAADAQPNAVAPAF